MVAVSVQPFEIEFSTREGVLLRADVYLPEHGSESYPVLLAASPYQKALRRLPAHWVFPFVEYGPMQMYLDEGYAYVIVDVPGSGRSEGVWDAVSRAEGEAIHDAIEHVAAQPWCDSNVGMIGQSYFAWSQWNAARTRPPHLKTIVPYDGSNDMYRDWLYHGGIPQIGLLSPWLMGAVMLQHQAEGHDVRGGQRHELLPNIISNTLDNDWHRRRSPFWELDQVDIPVFSIGAWSKAGLHLRGNVMGFNRVRGPKQLLLIESYTFSDAQRIFDDEDFHRREILPWYDHHLKGKDTKVMERPAVRAFVNGDGRYRSAECWPPPEATPDSYYLSSRRSGVVRSLNDGSLVGEPAGNDEVATSWSYPDPQWMLGVTTIIDGIPDHTARVVTYTSGEFSVAREFTGHGVLVLHGSTDQSDMDVIAKLQVLTPAKHGFAARKVTQGWLRASHRAEDPTLTQEMLPFHKHGEVDSLTPGTVYEMRIELLPMSFLVKPGERIRLEISNFDSLIADAPMTHWYGQKVGTDTYHHDAVHQSRLILPYCPR
ncbi:CocE/NonD family hydrolase [Pusillimonas sp.]|uniref:CocE/NonD family hydrolase n=1 Tax=Pusillimonas sp. TaxID=3040095 RepID=UPI0037C52B49